jgi:hypothetical protein
VPLLNTAVARRWLRTLGAMRVQTDRYNWSVPVSLDSDYAVGLLLASAVLIVVAGYYSGVQRRALSPNPIHSFCAVVGAASRRGEQWFWLVWGLIGVAGVLAFTAVVIIVGLVAFA